MRIDYVAPYAPWPPRSGEAVRMAGVVAGLASAHDLTVLLPPGGSTSGCPVPAIVADRVAMPGRIVPALAWRFGLGGSPTGPDQAALARLLAQRIAAEAVDLIVVANAALACGWPGDGLPALPVALDSHDVQSVRMRSLIADQPRHALLTRARLHDWLRRYRTAERRLYPRLTQVWSVSADDAAIHAGMAPMVDHRVVPNAVQVPPAPIAIHADGRRLLFVGAYGYPPNERSALHLIGLARAGALSGCTLEIAGRDPTPAMHAAATDVAGVTISGAFAQPADVHVRADLFVSSLTAGGGTKIKVLEALAAGLPCVLSPESASGLGLIDRQHALLAAPADISRAVEAALADPALRARLGAAGRALVEERFGAASQRAALHEAIAALATRSPR